MTLAAEASPLFGVIIGAVTTGLAGAATIIGVWLSARQKRRDQNQSGEQFTWQRMRELLDASRQETADVRAELAASEERCATAMARLRERVDQLEQGNAPP